MHRLFTHPIARRSSCLWDQSRKCCVCYIHCKQQGWQFSLGDAGMTPNPQWDSLLCCQIQLSKLKFLHQLFVRSDMSDHFLLKHLPHGLFYLLEEDLRNPTTQGVDGVQELGLDGVEQWLEHVVLKGKLQGQRHFPVSVLIPKLFQFDHFFNGTYPRLNGIYKLRLQGWGEVIVFCVNHKLRASSSLRGLSR